MGTMPKSQKYYGGECISCYAKRSVSRRVVVGAMSSNTNAKYTIRLFTKDEFCSDTK